MKNTDSEKLSQAKRTRDRSMTTEELFLSGGGKAYLSM
jgi:hypothetical protein